MNDQSFSSLSRYDICEKAEEAISNDNVEFLRQATDWIHRDDALDLTLKAAEAGSMECFRYLTDKLVTPQNKTSHMTSFLCRATQYDQSSVVKEFLPAVVYNMVSMSKIATQAIRYNASECFDVIISQPVLPPSVIPTAFLALLEMENNGNRRFMDVLLPRLDTQDMCSVFVSRFEQLHPSMDQEHASFLDDFLCEIDASDFDEIYPHLHPFTKDFDLPNVIARQSKIQLNKMLAPAIENKVKSNVGGSRKM